MRISTTIFAFFIICALSGAENLYSNLALSSVNQDGLPLNGTAFYAECGNSPGVFAHAGKTHLCTSFGSGICKYLGCYGCEDGTDAIISATYLGMRQAFRIGSWGGAPCVSTIGSCCYPSYFQDDPYASPPINDIPAFVFQTHTLRFTVMNGTAPADGATVTVSIPDGTYSEKCTVKAGECAFAKMPAGLMMSYAAGFAGETEEGALNLTQDMDIAVSFAHAATETPANGSDATAHMETAFRLDGKLPYIPYLIMLKPSNITYRENQDLSMENRTYPVSILAAGNLAYSTDVLPQPGDTRINLSSLMCSGGCEACGCGSDRLCTYSPLHNNYGCCNVGENWNGFSCATQHGTRVFIVLINHDPGKTPLSEVLEYVRVMDKYLGLGYGSYYIVNDSFAADSSYCEWERPIDAIFNSGEKRFKLNEIKAHFLDWYKQTHLYGGGFMGIQPASYRVIGVDFKNTCGDDACGFTMGGNIAYVSYHSCGNSAYIPTHELGHTFGLCDDYNQYIWDDQNGLFGSCPNARPTPGDSDCFSGNCTSDMSGACCYGIRFKDDGRYSMMGSGDLFDTNGTLLYRRFGNDSMEQIKKMLDWEWNEPIDVREL